MSVMVSWILYRCYNCSADISLLKTQNAKAPLLSRHRAQGLDEVFHLFIRHIVPGAVGDLSLTWLWLTLCQQPWPTEFVDLLFLKMVMFQFATVSLPEGVKRKVKSKDLWEVTLKGICKAWEDIRWYQQYHFTNWSNLSLMWRCANAMNHHVHHPSPVKAHPREGSFGPRLTQTLAKIGWWEKIHRTRWIWSKK